MHTSLNRWAAIAATVLAVAACADGPVSPPTATAIVSANATGKHNLGLTPYSCTVLRRTSSDTTWSQSRTTINYPQGELAPGNRTVPYRVRGMSVSGRVVFAAFCTVPYTEGALRRADRHFRVAHGGGADQYAARQNLVTTQGCVTDGVCPIDPIVVIAPPPDDEDDDSEDSGTGGGGGGGGGGDGGGNGGGSGGDDACADSYTQLIIDNPDCASPQHPTPEEEADARSCPGTLVGKVITALIPVASVNHEFRFEGPMTRVSAARSPATYEIAGPTASRDAWWIAERGTVQIICNGVYSPSAFGYKVWIGVASYGGVSDLHMVMGPGHPNF